MAARARLDHAAVVAEAVRLVDEEGVGQLSLGRLAERLGIRTPSLYNHVSGLPGLKHDLAVWCLQDLLAYFSRAAIGRAGAEAITAFGDAFRAYASTYPGRYFFTLEGTTDESDELYNIAERVLDVARAILAPYHLSEVETIHAIRGLRAIVQGFVALEAELGFQIPVSHDDSFHWLLNAYIAGLDRSARESNT